MYARATTESLHGLSDSQLVRRFRQGDDEALEVLLQRHSDDLYRFCRHLVSQREDAEDIFQESLARAIDRVDSLESESAFRGWLFRIARNLSVDSFRSRRRVIPLPEEPMVPENLHVDGPQDRVEVGEEHQTVAQALKRLVPSHRKVLVLREVEGLSYAEIADRLDVSHSAVETLLFRARKRLREEYSKSDPGILGLTGLAAIRNLGLRWTAPIGGGGSTAAKVALTAAVIGGAAATPEIFHPGHAALRAQIAEHRPGLEPGSNFKTGATAAQHVKQPGAVIHARTLPPARSSPVALPRTQPSVPRTIARVLTTQPRVGVASWWRTVRQLSPRHSAHRAVRSLRRHAGTRHLAPARPYPRVMLQPRFVYKAPARTATVYAGETRVRGTSGFAAAANVNAARLQISTIRQAAEPRFQHAAMLGRNVHVYVRHVALPVVGVSSLTGPSIVSSIAPASPRNPVLNGTASAGSGTTSGPEHASAPSSRQSIVVTIQTSTPAESRERTGRR